MNLNLIFMNIFCAFLQNIETIEVFNSKTSENVEEFGCGFVKNSTRVFGGKLECSWGCVDTVGCWAFAVKDNHCIWIGNRNTMEGNDVITESLGTLNVYYRVGEYKSFQFTLYYSNTVISRASATFG